MKHKPQTLYPTNKLVLTILLGFIIVNLSICNDIFAQELPNSSISMVNGKIPPGFYKSGIRYGNAKEDSLYIKWSHAMKADTFWIYKAGLNMEYITDTYTHSVWYNQPLRYERRMATHHLREYIFDSPLRFSDLESLVKNEISLLLGKNLYEYFSR